MKRTLLLWLALAPFCFAAELTILHTNDLHARLTPSASGRGGFAHLAGLIRREREGCNHCLLLNAGDLVQGSPVSTLYRGIPIFEIGNLFGFDAATLGNHDFDYGWKQARKFVEMARYPMVSANVVGEGGELFTAQPYIIREVNGIRVAIVGAVTENLKSLTTPDLMGAWHAAPLIATVRRYAAELRQRADIIVLLAHITEDEEKLVLRAAPQVAVTVSGHAHRGMTAPLANSNRLVVRVAGYGEELGRLDLDFDIGTKTIRKWSWKRLPVNTGIPAAEDVEEAVARWDGAVSKIVDVPLAVSKRAFTKAETKALIELAMRDATGADLAFMNPGGVRDVIPQGTVLARHVWQIMPFGNRIVVGRFKGSELPAAVTAGREIDPQREYTLAVTDFTAVNQSAPSELGATGLEFPRKGPVLRDTLISWVKKQRVLAPPTAGEAASGMQHAPSAGAPPVDGGTTPEVK